MLAKSIDEVREHASKILDMTLVIHQTGPEGRLVKRLLIKKGADIKKELYVGMVVDRGSQRVALMAPSESGMDIEEVAAHTPEKSIPQARAFIQSLYKTIDECERSPAKQWAS